MPAYFFSARLPVGKSNKLDKFLVLSSLILD